MPNQPIVNESFMYVYGLQIVYASATTLTMLSGQARNSTDVNDINLASTATLNFANTGINGIDQGALANSTLYYVYVVGDSTKNNASGGMASTSATPLIPGGYDMYRRIGWFFTNGSAQVLPLRVDGNGNSRVYTYDTLVSVKSAGADTTFTDVSCAAAVPPMATLVYLVGAITPATADNQLKLRRNGSSSTNGSAQLSGVVAAKVQVGQLTCPCDASAVIEYLVSNGSDAATIWVSGFLDQI